jgi:hypothetical protein
VARVEESETGEFTLKAARVTPEMAGLTRTRSINLSAAM